LQEEKTSARLKNLLPDQYEVSVAKEGFQTWHKKLPVYSMQTTFAQYIRLFKENPEAREILNKKILLTSELVNESVTIVYLQGDLTPLENEDVKYTLALLNLNNGDLNEITPLNFLPEKINLSPDKLYIFLEYDLEYPKHQWFVDVRKSELISVQDNIETEISRIAWEKDGRDEIVYLFSENGLERFNLNNLKTELILTTPVIDFVIYSNTLMDTIFYLTANEENVILSMANLNHLEDTKILASLPLSKNYRFLNSPNGLLTLLDNKNELLYLIKKNPKDKDSTIDAALTDTNMRVFTGVNQAKWLEGVLLLGNDFEISVYDLEKNEKDIIVRLSTGIKKMDWYPVPTHVIYLSADEIKVAELANHARNFNGLLTDAEISDFFITNKTNKIYLVNGDGMSELEIQ